jgi:hypothetical protein
LAFDFALSGHAFTGYGKTQSSMTVLKGGSKSGFCLCPYQGTPSGVPQSDRIRGRFSGGLCDQACPYASKRPGTNTVSMSDRFGA